MKLIEDKEAFDRMWDHLMGEGADNQPVHTEEISYTALRTPTTGIVLAYVIGNRRENKTHRLASDDVIVEYGL